MKTLAKTLLTGVAGIALLSGAALAQDDNNTSILDGVGDTLDSTVDSTLDTVDDVTTDLGVDDTIDDVTTGIGVNDTVNDVTGAGDVTGGDTGLTGGDASLGSIGTFSDLVGNIEGGATSVSDVTDVNDVSFVDAGSAFSDFDAASFGDVLSGNSASISDLQNEISGNAVLSEALANNDVDVSDVVAIDNHNDGSITIYTYQD